LGGEECENLGFKRLSQHALELHDLGKIFSAFWFTKYILQLPFKAQGNLGTEFKPLANGHPAKHVIYEFCPDFYCSDPNIFAIHLCMKQIRCNFPSTENNTVLTVLSLKG